MNTPCTVLWSFAIHLSVEIKDVNNKAGASEIWTLPWEAKHHKEGSFMSRVYSLLLTARVIGLRWVFRAASWLAESYRTWFDLWEAGLAIKNYTPASVSHGHLCHQHLFRNPLGYSPWTGNKHWRLRPNIQAFQFSFWFNSILKNQTTHEYPEDFNLVAKGKGNSLKLDFIVESGAKHHTPYTTENPRRAKAFSCCVFNKQS